MKRVVACSGTDCLAAQECNDAEHVFNHASRKCVLRNSPLGQIVMRAKDRGNVEVAAPLPAYADQVFREQVIDVTRRIGENNNMVSELITKVGTLENYLNSLRTVETAVQDHASKIKNYEDAISVSRVLKKDLEAVQDLVTNHHKELENQKLALEAFQAANKTIVEMQMEQKAHAAKIVELSHTYASVQELEKGFAGEMKIMAEIREGIALNKVATQETLTLAVSAKDEGQALRAELHSTLQGVKKMESELVVGFANLQEVQKEVVMAHEIIKPELKRAEHFFAEVQGSIEEAARRVIEDIREKSAELFNTVEKTCKETLASVMHIREEETKKLAEATTSATAVLHSLLEETRKQVGAVVADAAKGMHDTLASDEARANHQLALVTEATNTLQEEQNFLHDEMVKSSKEVEEQLHRQESEIAAVSANLQQGVTALSASLQNEVAAVAAKLHHETERVEADLKHEEEEIKEIHAKEKEAQQEQHDKSQHMIQQIAEQQASTFSHQLTHMQDEASRAVEKAEHGAAAMLEAAKTEAEMQRQAQTHAVEETTAKLEGIQEVASKLEKEVQHAETKIHKAEEEIESHLRNMQQPQYAPPQQFAPQQFAPQQFVAPQQFMPSQLPPQQHFVEQPHYHEQHHTEFQVQQEPPPEVHFQHLNLPEQVTANSAVQEEKDLAREISENSGRIEAEQRTLHKEQEEAQNVYERAREVQQDLIKTATAEERLMTQIRTVQAQVQNEEIQAQRHPENTALVNDLQAREEQLQQLEQAAAIGHQRQEELETEYQQLAGQSAEANAQLIENKQAYESDLAKQEILLKQDQDLRASLLQLQAQREVRGGYTRGRDHDDPLMQTVPPIFRMQEGNLNVAQRLEIEQHAMRSMKHRDINPGSPLYKYAMQYVRDKANNDQIVQLDDALLEELRDSMERS